MYHKTSHQRTSCLLLSFSLRKKSEPILRNTRCAKKAFSCFIFTISILTVLNLDATRHILWSLITAMEETINIFMLYPPLHCLSTIFIPVMILHTSKLFLFQAKTSYPAQYRSCSISLSVFTALIWTLISDTSFMKWEEQTCMHCSMCK